MLNELLQPVRCLPGSPAFKAGRNCARKLQPPGKRIVEAEWFAGYRTGLRDIQGGIDELRRQIAALHRVIREKETRP